MGLWDWLTGNRSDERVFEPEATPRPVIPNDEPCYQVPSGSPLPRGRMYTGIIGRYLRILFINQKLTMLHILGHLAGRSLLLHKCQACLCNLQLLQAYKAPLDEIVNPCKWLIFIEIPLTRIIHESQTRPSDSLHRVL